MYQVSCTFIVPSKPCTCLPTTVWLCTSMLSTLEVETHTEDLWHDADMECTLDPCDTTTTLTWNMWTICFFLWKIQECIFVGCINVVGIKKSAFQILIYWIIKPITVFISKLQILQFRYKYALVVLVQWYNSFSVIEDPPII